MRSAIFLHIDVHHIIRILGYFSHLLNFNLLGIFLKFFIQMSAKMDILIYKVNKDLQEINVVLFEDFLLPHIVEIYFI